jgi:lysophospholipase L1-like esterase
VNRILALCAFALTVSGVALAEPTVATQVEGPGATHAAAGPTPYPKVDGDWPGKGAIRSFGYMSTYRQSWWGERERKQGSVAFAGDSLIARWRTLAEDLSGLRVANRGMDAEVTRGLLFRFKEDVLDLHPKAIVLLIGTNDLSVHQDVQFTRSNIDEMLDTAERVLPGVPIVLCTLPPRADDQSPVELGKLGEVNALIVAAARGREHVAVLDLHTLLAEPDGSPNVAYFAADKLHLSAPGYKRIRDALVPLLKKLNVG